MRTHVPKSEVVEVQYPESSPLAMWYVKHDKLLVSEGHLKRGGTYVEGGPFYCYHVLREHEAPLGHLTHTRNDVTYSGTPRGCGTPPGGKSIAVGKSVTFTFPSWLSMQAMLLPYAATGFNRTRPGNPQAGLGQFLGELRDLPKIPGRGIIGALKGRSLQSYPRYLFDRLRSFLSLSGSEYLNYQFGWRPFVKDLKDMYYVWRYLDKLIAQIRRDNGRNIRRSTTLYSDTSTSQTTPTSYNFAYALVYNAPPNWHGGSSLVVQTEKVEERIWYSSSMRYWIPDTTSSLWTAQAKAALFGVLPTPSVLYELLPWSWLIDWFSNVGDVVANVSPNAVDNLVLNYHFVMRSWKRTLESTSFSNHTGQVELNQSNIGPQVLKKWDPAYAAFRSREILEVKARVGGGSPYLPGVQLSGLTAYQLSILAALGISRGKVK